MTNSAPPPRDFAAYRDALRTAYSPTQRDRERLRDSFFRSFADDVPRPDIEQLAAAVEPRLFARPFTSSYPFLRQAAALLAAAGVGAAIALTLAPRLQRTPLDSSETQGAVAHRVPPRAASDQTPRDLPGEQATTLPSPPVAIVETPAGQPPQAAAALHRRTPLASHRVSPAETSNETKQPDDLAGVDMSPATEASGPPAPEARSSLTDELRLIRAASEALDTGKPAIALERLVEHSRRFPAGVLAIERRGLELIARCTFDPRAPLQGERDLFLARFPTAPIAARVSRTCENAR